MTRSYIAVLMICQVLYAGAQSSALKKADKYFASRSYALAIPLYEQAQKSDTGTTAASRLAECYRVTNNVNGQVETYGRLIRNGQATPTEKLHYAEALAASGRFADAKPYFEAYTGDARGQVKSRVPGNFSKNADAYKLTFARYNSAQSDFGAIGHKGKTHFLSSRQRTSWITYLHGWTGQPVVRLHSIKEKDDVSCPEKTGTPRVLNEGPFTFANDTLLYITMNEATASGDTSEKKLKIFALPVSKGKYGKPRMLSICNGSDNYAHPSVSADGGTLYFSSDREGGYGGMDLYASVKNTNGDWAPPENLGEKVNTAGNELFPFISERNLLYFASNGHEGLGGLDIYETRIREGVASRVYNMGVPVNSRDDDFAMSVLPGGRTGYLSSNRLHGGMDDDIYHVDFLREVKRGKDVEIVFRDKHDNNVQPDNVWVYSGNDSTQVTAGGKYTTVVDESQTLRLRAASPGYFMVTDSIVAAAYNEDKITRTITLEKDPRVALVIEVRDLKSGKILDSANVSVKELPSMQLMDVFTTTVTPRRLPLPGKRINDKISYEFTLSRPGYLAKKVIFIHDIKKPGDINVAEFIELSIGKVEVGMDVGRMIDLKPIYFDLGKSSIRPDAAAELDKVAAIMTEFPNMSIELGSHSDCRGAAKTNLKLSDARARSSAAYIVKKGIDKGRITGKGYGESRLLNNCACEGKAKTNCSEEEHAKNRRTEFIITRLK